MVQVSFWTFPGKRLGKPPLDERLREALYPAKHVGQILRIAHRDRQAAMSHNHGCHPVAYRLVKAWVELDLKVIVRVYIEKTR
jgi:hypothetical protein